MLSSSFTQDFNEHCSNRSSNTEIEILKQSVKTLTDKVENLEMENKTIMAVVRVLEKIAVHYDESHSSLLEKFNKLKEEQDEKFEKLEVTDKDKDKDKDNFDEKVEGSININYEKLNFANEIDRLDNRIEKMISKLDIFEKMENVPDGIPVEVQRSGFMEISLNEVSDSAEDSERSSYTDSPLTKKQKKSRKKHQWRKVKRTKEQIETARIMWINQNKYSDSVSGSGMFFL